MKLNIARRPFLEVFTLSLPVYRVLEITTYASAECSPVRGARDCRYLLVGFTLLYGVSLTKDTAMYEICSNVSKFFDVDMNIRVVYTKAPYCSLHIR